MYIIMLRGGSNVKVHYNERNDTGEQQYNRGMITYAVLHYNAGGRAMARGMEL